MKKFLTTVLALTVGASAMAQVLVYDYKASIKRIEPVFAKKAGAVTESYKTVSDTIMGYVILSECVDCNVDGVADFLKAEPGVAYLTRKGDKLSAKANDFDDTYGGNKGQVVWSVVKTVANVDAALFGAYVNHGQNPVDGTPQKSKKNANKAWMFLSYTLPNAEQANTLYSILVTKYGNTSQNELMYYGFFGVDNLDAGTVDNAGFGTAKVMVKKIAGTPGTEGGVCTPGTPATPGTEESCSYIASISGTITGAPTYQGPCGVTPMWDVCSWANVVHPQTTAISGTWTLKYNSKLTKQVGAAAEAEREAAILKALKKEAADMIDLTVQAPVAP